MWLRVSCKLAFNIELSTPFVLMLRPRSGEEQWIERDEFKIAPNVPITEFTDHYGNLCQRLVAPKGNFSIHTTSDVKTSEFVDVDFDAPFVEIKNLPNDILCYLLPSRYCESDRFNELANAITANVNPGYSQVFAIEEWLRTNISYIPGSSEYPISAIEVNYKLSGVCRDLAHLGIALCRSLSIPARMVVGYLHNLYPMDMHAWFEAFVGGRWYTFDATQTGIKGGYVSVGYGLDAADVAIFNQFGPVAHSLQQSVSVIQIKN
ncbi:Transglutaminase-like enzyme, putative cysteine protease [Polaribacter sp. KT25b]|uniref:transglutaminase-like domain-containing protein n=1 Tax=Polaribacter sp. KT25b TaxID=1855336 RepID=UPI00087A9DCE|nr:transglutaminase family protein [Polaribacter sp. KT25b]SDS02261.1 Transglutaminase-like enzyme, putative cysteine protease [Polaribacter sp. KT25b]